MTQDRPNHPPRRQRSGLIALALGLALAPAAAWADADIGGQPEQIAGVRVAEVAAAQNHSCARLDNGWVYCWGGNASGQLGDGTYANRNVPTRVTGLTEVTQIVAGEFHSCALRSNARVLCWGSNASGQLGVPGIFSSTTPVRVRNLSNVTQVAGGRNHNCALRANGRVFCWGANADGQLGDGTTDNSAAIVRVVGPATTSAVQVTAGSGHSCLLRGGGRVTCWGRNVNGQLGTGNYLPQAGPVVVMQLSGVTQIATGNFHNCALRGNQRVFCWGSNLFGQVGNGTNSNQYAWPVRVDDITSVTALSAGSAHTCAIRGNGRVFCWGHNTEGRLGDGTVTTRNRPVRVDGPLMINAISIAAGGTHSCGVRSNGRAYCWGANTVGQLGNGTNFGSVIPVRARD